VTWCVAVNRGHWLVLTTWIKFTCLRCVSIQAKQVLEILVRMCQICWSWNYPTALSPPSGGFYCVIFTRLTNALNINSSHLRIKFSQPTSQPDCQCPHNLIFVQFTRTTHSLSIVTLVRPSVSSLIQITICCLIYASPFLWNQFPSPFRHPLPVHSPPGSPHPACITSSQSQSLLSPSVAPLTFYSRLKLIGFTNPFLHSLFGSIWVGLYLDCQILDLDRT